MPDWPNPAEQGSSPGPVWPVHPPQEPPSPAHPPYGTPPAPPYATPPAPPYGGGYRAPHGGLPGYPYPGSGASVGHGPSYYKGARYHLPDSGPSSLAGQWTRLGARILDGIIFLPVIALCEIPAIIYLVNHINALASSTNGTSTLPPQEVARADGIFFACSLLAVAAEVLWEGFANRRWGRTPGKAIVHIRPMRVRLDQSGLEPLTPEVCWGRPAIYFAFSLVSFLGLIDDLWCLWDGERQCLHDKVARTVVIRDA